MFPFILLYFINLLRLNSGEEKALDFLRFLFFVIRRSLKLGG